MLIVTQGRFTETDEMLFKEARAWEIPCYLMRNKTDVDLENNEDEGIPPAETKRVLWHDLAAHLARNGAVETERIFVTTTKARKYPTELEPEWERLCNMLKADIARVRS